MSFRQRRAANRAADAERQDRNEPTGRDPLYGLPYHERRRLRRAEAQGEREAEQLAAIEERAKKQAEDDALPDHERRPPNVWRQLIELRKPDAGRKEVARRIRLYEREARLEDERIDALMEERRKRYELESQPEYARALAHWERAHVAAESDQEREQWARLRGLIEGGGALGYWDQVAPIVQARLEKMHESLRGQLAKQAAVVEESKALAAEVEAVSELQITQGRSDAPDGNL